MVFFGGFIGAFFMCAVYVIAAIIGARFGFFGMIASVMLAHFFINSIRIGTRPNAAQQAEREAVFVETLFSLMGALAKADGVISQREIDHAEALIAKMNMNSEHRAQAIAHFRRGAQRDFDLNAQLAKFNAACHNAHHLKRLLLTQLINKAMMDGKFQNAERDLLQQIGILLGFNRSILELLFNQSRYQYRTYQGGYQQGYSYSNSQSHSQFNARQSEDELAQAYGALGVTQSASDAQIKRAYRKLMSANHPDKLMGQGMPADMIELATQKSQQIQSAYELIKKARGIH